MSNFTAEQVLLALADIAFEDGTKLTSLVSNIIIKGTDIGFAVNIGGQNPEEAEKVRLTAINTLTTLPNIGKISIVLTKEVNSKEGNKAGKKYLIDNVKKVILVAAGKGGVGKSTVTALIAQYLANTGYKIGIVDADIYGPSIPQIFGLSQKPVIIADKMQPLKSRNLEIISIGFLVPEDSALAWRGPMVSKAIYRLLSLTAWGDLDYLIIDMPPGTGDIHLSILENYRIDGVLMVTTPQRVSRIDVEKSINLYQKFSVPILGIIENMSYLTDNTGNRMQIFSGSSGKYLAEKYKLRLLQELPIIPAIAESCDRAESLVDVEGLEGSWVLDMVKRV